MISCRACGTELEVQDGRQKTCGPVCAKAAEKARIQRYKDRHPERVAANKARYYANWASANQEHLRIKKAEWHARNPDYGKDWYAANIERGRANKAEAQRRRRARRNGGGVFTISDRDRSRSLARFGNRCAYCSSSFSAHNPLQWDHVVPIARGGRDSVGNLLPSCRRCNQSKNDRFLVVWRKLRTAA